MRCRPCHRRSLAVRGREWSAFRDTSGPLRNARGGRVSPLSNVQDDRMGPRASHRCRPRRKYCGVTSIDELVAEGHIGTAGVNARFVAWMHWPVVAYVE